MKERRGFTLVELIVGLLLISILTLAAIDMFVTQLRVSTQQNKISEAQSDINAALNLMRWDIMMAGFGNQNGIVSFNNNPDQFTINSFASPVGGSGDWSYFTSTISGNTGLVRKWSNVTENLAVGDSVVVFSENKVNLGTSKITGVQNTGDPNVAKITFNQNIDAKKGSLIFAIPPGGTNFNYYINNNVLMRGNMTIQSGMEDMEVAYWIDSNGNGVQDAGEWLDNVTQNQLDSLKLVRLSVVKTIGPDNTYTYPFNNVSVEDHTYTLNASQKHYRRRIYQIIIKPRNISL